MFSSQIVDFEVKQLAAGQKRITAAVNEEGTSIKGDIFVLANGNRAKFLASKLGLWLPVFGFKSCIVSSTLKVNSE